jgi:excisionase family DNA binding protein
MTKEDLQKLADLITVNVGIFNKEVLSSQEAAKYMGISLSTLYKLTMTAKVPHSKPGGKMCYFNRVELERWLQSNRVATADELEQKAQSYCIKKGGAL